MKRSLSVLLLASLAALGCEMAPAVTPPPPVATAPVVTTPPPPTATPADPATVTEGDVTVAWVNGMQVLVKRIPGSDWSAGQLYVRGGVRNWTEDNAGIEELALSTAASGGTEKLDKDAFARRLAELGSSVGAGSGADFGSFRMKCLSKEWDHTFPLLADAFLHPALPAADLEIERQQQLATLRHEQESADGRLRFVVNQTFFAGHPYSHRAVGTLASVSKIQLDDARAHLAKLRETGRLVFVAAGDVDPAHVIDQVKSAFGGLPRGDYKEAPLPRVSFDKAGLTVEEKKLPTNYIESVFPAPSVGDADYAKATVAMSVLGYRFFEEIRTKRNLSYAASAHLSSNYTIGLGVLYVTAVDPNTTRKVMNDEVHRLQTEPISDKELAGHKSIFLTGYLMENEATDGQAGMLARAQLLGGDWRLAKTLPARIQAVTAADLQAFAKTYAQHMQTIVIGDPAKIDRALFTSM
jgi:zinc protease